MSRHADPDGPKHTVPVIDRMMEVLTVIERRTDGASIREITEQTGQARSTIYRILNTLHQHNIVRRDAGGVYRLGARLLELASHVAPGSGALDLAALAQPELDRLSMQLGESCKLSVLDQQGVLVLAVAQGRRDYAPIVTPGQRIPAHIGAAGKLLLAHLSAAEQQVWLQAPMDAFTAKSITDPKKLRREMARIAKQGWAQDKGESAPSIYAFAAPVFGRDGDALAGLSVPFLAGVSPERMEEIRLATIAAAKAITAAVKA